MKGQEWASTFAHFQITAKYGLQIRAKPNKLKQIQNKEVTN